MFIKKGKHNRNGKNTKVIYHHDVMSFCFYAKPSGDIPVGLLKKFDIEMKPTIFRGDSSFNKEEIAKGFFKKLLMS